MSRIDTHHHVIPPFYRAVLHKAGVVEAGGRALPEWSADASLEAMDLLGVSAAILSVSTPGTTFLTDGGDAAALARDLNDYTADLVAKWPSRFGFLATVPLPHRAAAVAESVRALDELHADGVVLLANSGGIYLGEEATTICSPHSTSARPRCSYIPPTCPDRQSGTCRRSPPTSCSTPHVRRTYLCATEFAKPIRISDSSSVTAGGFVPYASHRMSLPISADTGRSVADILGEFATFYFDTALSSSPAALPTLLAFAHPGHITFGSDWPFAPLAAANWFSTNLDAYSHIDAAGLAAINVSTAVSLFPRFIRPVE